MTKYDVISTKMEVLNLRALQITEVKIQAF